MKNKNKGIISKYNKLIFVLGFLCLFSTAFSATKQSTLSQEKNKTVVTGIVKDALGETVIGATVVEKGNLLNGVITGIDGEFSLKVANDATIIVSYIGFKTKEISTIGKSALSIIIEEDTQALDEVVVVGYGIQKKENLTGAISQVKMDAVLGDRPVTSIASALQGAVPGLNITGGSVPGTSKTINIRGTTSINGGSPLILIDNVPGDIDMVNPEDIESVTTLKDAASAAIYGARGAFGVIIITTKKAKKNSPLSINYNNNFGFQVPTDKLEQPDMLTILETMQHWDNNNFYHSQGQDYDKWMGYIKDYRSGELMKKYPTAYLKDGRFVAPDDDIYYSLEATNPQESILSDYGFQQTHNISATGGSDKITYRMSLGYTNQDGPLQMDKDTYSRISISSYVNAEITEWMSTSIDLRYAKSERKYVQSSSLYGHIGMPSWYPSGDIPLSSDLDGDTWPTIHPLNYIIHSDPTLFDEENPRIFSRTVFTPVEGLEAVFEYTYNRENASTRRNNKEGVFINDAMANILLNNTPSYKVDKSTLGYNSLNLYATYQRQIKEKHNFKIMAGYNQDMRDKESSWTERKELMNSSMPSISGGIGELTAGDAYDQYTIRSGFFRFNYNYDERFLLEVNGRYDGSSKFPKDSRFGFFSSFSAGWNIAKEEFMNSTDEWINELKPRISWGQLGNQDISTYAFYSQMKSEYPSWIVDGSKPISLSMPGLISSDFTWEIVETLDIGLDFSFLNNRLSGVFDWYQRDTKGMLAPGAEIPEAAGTSAPEQNVADLRTRGWEFAISWRDRIDDWKYSVGFNIYDDRTEITDYDNEAQLFGKYQNKLRYREGMELGEIWGYVSDGFYSIDDFQEEHYQKGNWLLKDGVTGIKGNNNIRPGDVKFKNLNDYSEENVIDAGNSTVMEPGDRKIIGNDKARYNFGINGSLGWKNFDLSVMFQGTGKRDYWYADGNAIRFPMVSEFSTVYEHQLDYWQPISTDITSPDFYKPINPNPTFGRIYNQNSNGGSNNRVQTQHLLDASYIRLKNVTLSYSVPTNILDKIGLQRAKVFFSGENLVTFTNLPQGMDPERLSWGYPFFATYSFGVSLTL